MGHVTYGFGGGGTGFIGWTTGNDTPPETTASPTLPAGNPAPTPTQQPSNGPPAFTTSAYGTAIPIVYGSDKITGNVFWASPVRMKLLPDGVTMYRSCDFAFGLCEGEISGVLRMWLGERLIYSAVMETDNSEIAQPNADGAVLGSTLDLVDPKSPLAVLSSAARETRVTVYRGTETQVPQDIMTETEGLDNCPGYRGLAYVVFENWISTDAEVPDLYVEVSSHVDAKNPRLYTNVSTQFTRTSGDALIMDLLSDVAYVAAKDYAGTKSPANGEGIVVVNANTLDNEAEYELKSTLSITSPQWATTRILPTTGYLMLHSQSGNAGILRVYDPNSNAVLDTLGPGGSVADHNLTTGMSALDPGSLSFVSYGNDGLVLDAFMGFGSINGSLGFAVVDGDGAITFISNLSNVINEEKIRGAPLTMTLTSTRLRPTFMDGASTLGQFIMLVEGAINETDSFTISRVTVNSPSTTIEDPVYDQLMTISTTSLGGSGLRHQLETVLIDPIDLCMVIFFSSPVLSTGGWACKVSPYNGTIIWSVSAPNFPTMQAANVADLTVAKYAWIASGGAGIFTMDLRTGQVTRLASNVSEFSLPAPNGAQYYSGGENAIYYTSSTSGEHVVKVFLERQTRATADVSDIITELLGRVGLLPTDIAVADLSALTVNGYTVDSRKSLRDIFSELAQVFKFDVVESNGRIKYLARGGATSTTIDHKYLADQGEGWIATTRDVDISRVRKIDLRYRDLDREYKDNVQSVHLPSWGDQTFDTDAGITVTVPVVLRAELARKLAEILLYAKLTYDQTFKVNAPSRFLDLDPGDVVEITDADGGDNHVARVRKVSIGGNRQLSLELSEENPDIFNDIVNIFADVGRFEGSEFQPREGRVDPYVMALPPLSDSDAFLCTAGITTRFGIVFLNIRPNGVMPTSVGMTVDDVSYSLTPVPDFPTWGNVTNPPNDTTAKFSTDTTSVLRVKIINHNTDKAPLVSKTVDQVLASNTVNLAYVGGELIQFETATDEGNGIWAFTNLHRGRLGTDDKIGTQRIGSKFILVNYSTMNLIRVPATTPTRTFRIDQRNGMPIRQITAESLAQRAWAPNVQSFNYSGDDAVITWERRARFQGEYEDDGLENVPLFETDERYYVVFFTDPDTFSPTDDTTYLRKVEVTGNSRTYTYASADQTTDGFDNTTTTLYATVWQQGSLAGYRDGALSDYAQLDHK